MKKGLETLPSRCFAADASGYAVRPSSQAGHEELVLSRRDEWIRGGACLPVTGH